MFCSICQKSFKHQKTYQEHQRSDNHKFQEGISKANPKEFKRNLSNKFLEHFVSFISNLKEKCEINSVYSKYIINNKYRINGTFYRTINDVLEDIENKVFVEKIDGAVYVKRLEPENYESSVDVEDLVFDSNLSL